MPAKRVWKIGFLLQLGQTFEPFGSKVQRIDVPDDRAPVTSLNVCAYGRFLLGKDIQGAVDSLIRRIQPEAFLLSRISYSVRAILGSL